MFQFPPDTLTKNILPVLRDISDPLSVEQLIVKCFFPNFICLCSQVSFVCHLQQVGAVACHVLQSHITKATTAATISELENNNTNNNGSSWSNDNDNDAARALNVTCVGWLIIKLGSQQRQATISEKITRTTTTAQRKHKSKRLPSNLPHG